MACRVVGRKGQNQMAPVRGRNGAQCASFSVVHCVLELVAESPTRRPCADALATQAARMLRHECQPTTPSRHQPTKQLHDVCNKRRHPAPMQDVQLPPRTARMHVCMPTRMCCMCMSTTPYAGCSDAPRTARMHARAGADSPAPHMHVHVHALRMRCAVPGCGCSAKHPQKRWVGPVHIPLGLLGTFPCWPALLTLCPARHARDGPLGCVCCAAGCSAAL